MKTNSEGTELAAAEKRIAANPPAEAEPVREIRAIVTAVATSDQPDSLQKLRQLVDQRGSIPTGQRSLLQYVLMDMLDKRELEISNDRRLIVNLAA